MKKLNVNKNFTKSNQNGITLIALIVTIVVLIIIAGISIATLTSDNGVLRQTNLAKITQIEATAREQVKLACSAMRLAIAEARADDNSYSAVANSKSIQAKLLKMIEDDNTGLNKEGWGTEAEVNDNVETFTITYAGDDYKQACNNDDATITYTIKLGQSAIEITNEVNATLQDEEGNDVEIDIGGDVEENPGDEGGAGGDSGSGTGVKIADKVKVGDYINYSEKLTAQTYDTDTDETGYTDSQTFATDTSMSWRVMSINDDGSVDIVATKNVLANDNATGLYLSGQTGFLNAEIVLKNLCEKLYENSSYGIARSINDEDINGLTGFDPETSEWTGYEDMKSFYGIPQTYTSGGPFWDKASNTFKTPTPTAPVTVDFDIYGYQVDTSMPLYDTLIQESTTYTGDMSETNYPLFYWLGSRCAVSVEYGARFIVRAVEVGVVRGLNLFYADAGGESGEFPIACAVRPVINLRSEVLIDTSDATLDGSTSSSAYKLILE